MGGKLDEIGIAEARSALAWWLDAGVDVAVQEDPRDWLRPPPPPSYSLQLPRPRRMSPNRAPTPSPTCNRGWQAARNLPLSAGAARRIAPHGPENAAVMLLSDRPALEDATAGQPIGGNAWALTQRMLAAIGISADDAYSASLACFHTPGARMSDQDREACAEIARRHIRLVQPKRLLLFGDGPSLALLGKRVLEARGHAHKVEGVRTVATFHPRELINRPSNKSLAWQDLLLLMEDEA